MDMKQNLERTVKVLNLGQHPLTQKMTPAHVNLKSLESPAHPSPHKLPPLCLMQYHTASNFKVKDFK